MPADEPWTIGRLLTWTTDFLREKGADSPRLDAEVLLAHARDCQRIDLYTVFPEQASESLLHSFRELVRRRAAGMPVAYLVGYREFFSLAFRVTPEVLIPRPESEQLVVQALDLGKQMPVGAPLRIADVGTGSGVLAVCCAKHLPQAAVTALDISPTALEIARQNAAAHQVAQQVEFLQSDLLAACSPASEFDLIVSNPPYVTSAELEQLDADVRQFEPRLALDGGAEGTAVIERLLPQAAARLRPGGWLLMEIGPSIAARAQQLVSQTKELQSLSTLADISGLPRVLQAQRRERPS